MKDAQKLMDNIVTQYAHKVRDYEDSTCYAYLKLQINHLKEIGEDPRNYEVVFLQDEYPEHTDDGMKITKRFRLRKFR